MLSTGRPTSLPDRLETGHIIGLSLILDVLDLHRGDA
jgi:hypothetical protein